MNVWTIDIIFHKWYCYDIDIYIHFISYFIYYPFDFDARLWDLVHHQHESSPVRSRFLCFFFLNFSMIHLKKMWESTEIPMNQLLFERFSMIFQWFSNLEAPFMRFLPGSGTSKTSGGYAHDELEEFDMLQKVAAAKIQRRSKESFQRPVPQHVTGGPLWLRMTRSNMEQQITRKLQKDSAQRCRTCLLFWCSGWCCDIWGDVWGFPVNEFHRATCRPVGAGTSICTEDRAGGSAIGHHGRRLSCGSCSWIFPGSHWGPITRAAGWCWCDNHTDCYCHTSTLNLESESLWDERIPLFLFVLIHSVLRAL